MNALKSCPCGATENLKLYTLFSDLQFLRCPDCAAKRAMTEAPGPEAHRQATGHGYSQEVVTGKWKCDRCKAKGRV